MLFAAAGTGSVLRSVFRIDRSGGVRAIHRGVQHGRRGGYEEPARGVRAVAQGSDGFALQRPPRKQLTDKNLT